MARQVRIFDCGIYKNFDCQLKRKYSEDRSPIVLPDEFTVLIVSQEMRGELLKSLSTVPDLILSRDNR